MTETDVRARRGRRHTWFSGAVAVAVLAGCSGHDAPATVRRTTTTAEPVERIAAGRPDDRSARRVVVDGQTTMLVPDGAVTTGTLDARPAPIDAPTLLGSIEVSARRIALTSTGPLHRPIVLDTVVTTDAQHSDPVAVRYDDATRGWQPVSSDLADGHLTIYAPSAGTYAWARWNWDTARSVGVTAMRDAVVADHGVATPTRTALGQGAPSRSISLLTSAVGLSIGMRAGSIDRARRALADDASRRAVGDALTSDTCHAAMQPLLAGVPTIAPAVAHTLVTGCTLRVADAALAHVPGPVAAVASALAARSSAPPDAMLLALAQAATTLADTDPIGDTTTTVSATSAANAPATDATDPSAPMADTPAAPTSAAATSAPPPATTTAPATAPPATATPAPPTTEAPPSPKLDLSPGTCHVGKKGNKADASIAIRASSLTPGGAVTVVIVAPSGDSTSTVGTASERGTVQVEVACDGLTEGRWTVTVEDAARGRRAGPATFQVKK